MNRASSPVLPVRRIGRRVPMLAALLAGAFLWTGASPRPLAAEEAGAGLYIDRCSRCHGLVDDSAAARGFFRPAVVLPLGPTLRGVWGRRAGTVSGFRYSDAFLARASGIVWNADTLNPWIADSQAMIPGSYMIVKVPPEERGPIIEYLRTHAAP